VNHKPFPLVDGHLDLAYNAVSGRDLTRSALETRALEGDRPNRATVSLPDLRRGGLALAFATLFANPATSTLSEGGYRTPEEAEAQALAQLAVYEDWEARGLVRIVRDRSGLAGHLAAWAKDGVPGLLVLMEGADPIREPGDLDAWWDRGVRAIGPAWHRTRYCGGTGGPGGLSAIGAELVALMRERGVILDLSHMADEAIADSLAIGAHAVMASHANARALVPTDRQLSNDTIRAVAERDGVIGIVLFNRFLEARWSREDRSVPVSVEQVAAHARHIAGLAGWERVAIGSDMDGGLGVDETPIEIDTIADFSKIGEAVPAEARSGFLGLNWIRFLERVLP
jgi:membrane dipeptidase